MKIKTIAAGILFAGIAVAGPASAQPSTSAEPNYGTLTLRGGFTPDPRVVSVQAGGNLEASSAARNCQGFISSAPDVRLNFTPGRRPLIISVASGTDTTLVVNAPDGRWYCDDDGGVNGSNPQVRFNRAQRGSYEIWVGTFSSGNAQPARLHISEVRSQ